MVSMGITTVGALDVTNQIGNVVVMQRQVPNRIREWRRAAGLTQERLAEIVGTTGQSIGRKEKGDRSTTIYELEQIAAALGCRPADLLQDPESVLSNEERRLVKAYEKMTEADRQALLRIADALVHGQVPHSPPKLKRRPN